VLALHAHAECGESIEVRLLVSPQRRAAKLDVGLTGQDSAVKRHSAAYSRGMNIDIQNIPSPSKLIMTMDKHPVGASLFIAGFSILLVVLLVCLMLWLNAPAILSRLKD
jgi:hypothetical protein